MDKKVAIVVYPGLEYSKAVKYGQKSAQELNAGLILIGIIPDLDASGATALAIGEYGPYANVTGRMEKESKAFFDQVSAYCTAEGIRVEKLIEKGSIEEVIEKFEATNTLSLIIVPTPTKSAGYSVCFDSLKNLAQEIPSGATKCPVVAVF